MILDKRQQQDVKNIVREYLSTSYERKQAATPITNLDLANKKYVDTKLIGQSQLKYETASITISGTSTSGTATITSGDIVLGYYVSSVSGAAIAWVIPSISGTTLTVTLSQAPGTGNSITVVTVLLKT